MNYLLQLTLAQALGYGAVIWWVWKHESSHFDSGILYSKTRKTDSISCSLTGQTGQSESETSNLTCKTALPVFTSSVPTRKNALKKIGLYNPTWQNTQTTFSAGAPTCKNAQTDFGGGILTHQNAPTEFGFMLSDMSEWAKGNLVYPFRHALSSVFYPNPYFLTHKIQLYATQNIT